MARTWERESEKKLVIQSYRKVCPCCHSRDIYQEMRFLFYFLFTHSGFERAGVRIRENHRCLTLWTMNSG